MDDEFIVQFRKEGDDWLAFYVDRPHISAYGDTPAEALQELGDATQAMEDSEAKV